jgi:hypothetical protein
VKLIREPLLHFLVLGAGLFLLFEVLEGGQAIRPDAGPERLVVSAAKVEQLAIWAKQRGRPPTEPELRGLVEGHIVEEILYREALALGLDRDDTIVRRRLRQKMDFIVGDLAAAREPTDGELQAFLDENAERFLLEGRVAFRHVYVDTDRRGEAAGAEATRLLAVLNAGGPEVDTSELGDRFLLEVGEGLQREGDVARLLGREFTEGLREVGTGHWGGPVQSAYGLHLVLVTERVPGRKPALPEVRDVVRRDWLFERRREAEASFLAALRERYRIEVGGPVKPRWDEP